MLVVGRLEKAHFIYSNYLCAVSPLQFYSCKIGVPMNSKTIERLYFLVKVVWFLGVGMGLFNSHLIAQNVGIGTSVPDPSARLEVRDTTRGILIPRLTTAQRNNIANPAHSLLIFNVDNFCIEVYDTVSKSWLAVSCPAACSPCDTCPLPVVDSVRGPVVLCSGDTVEYVAWGSNYTTVVWNPPLGWLYLGGLDTGRFVAGQAGLVHISLCNHCGCVVDSVRTLSGVAPGMVSLIGRDSICLTDTAVIHASGGTGYVWHVPMNWSVIFQGDSLVALPLDTGLFFIGAQACNNCGCSPIDSISIVVLDTVISNVAIIGPSNVCAGDTIIFRAVNAYGMYWNWQYPVSWQLVLQDADSILLIPDTVDGNVIVEVCNAGGCKCVSDTVSVIADSCSTFCIAYGASNNDVLYGIIADGNSVVFGGELENASRDAVIGKVDLNGNLLWSYVYDGPSNGWDAVTSIDKLPGGNYVFIGWVAAGWNGTWDNQVGEIDASTGVIVTHKMVYGFEEFGIKVINGGNRAIYTGSNNDCGYFTIIDLATSSVITKYCGPAYGWNVIQHSSGSFYVIGNQLHICKFNSSGNPEWCYSYGTGALKWITELPGGDLVVAGYDNNDIVVMRVDTNGNVVWAKKWDAGGSSETTYGYCCSGMGVLKSNGNILITGTTDAGSLGGTNVVVFEMDTQGTLVWSKLYGDSGNEYGGAIDVLSNGQIVVGGITNSFGNGGQDMLIMTLSPNGLTNCTVGCRHENGGVLVNFSPSQSALSLPTISSSPTTTLSGGTTGGNVVVACP